MLHSAARVATAPIIFGAVIAGLSISGVSAQGVTSLDEISVGATKTEEKAIDSLAAVSTQGKDQLQQTQASRISDLVYQMPSVWFQERGDRPESSINIRGLQDYGRVAVLIDGARQNFQVSGHNANGTFFLEPELLAGVEVVRGPVANVYGSGAIGGVASFRTKDTGDILLPGERWGFQAHVSHTERLSGRSRQHRPELRLRNRHRHRQADNAAGGRP
jgi:hemoglobin/transferrin/lactoferrin receptor protein